jgi:catechol 2,3-dioxygenase-like lactoylglutathione lyase family enzyme
VLIAPPHPREPNATAPSFPHYGLEHIGLTVDDVDAAVEELRGKGAEIAIGPLTRNPGLRLAFIRGAEGDYDRARAAIGARAEPRRGSLATSGKIPVGIVRAAYAIVRSLETGMKQVA